MHVQCLRRMADSEDWGVAMYRTIGLMSGTSMDGVDVALIDTDAGTNVTLGPSAFSPYSDVDRALLRAGLDAARELTDRTVRPGVLAEAERMVTVAPCRGGGSFCSGSWRSSAPALMLSDFTATRYCIAQSKG